VIFVCVYVRLTVCLFVFLCRSVFADLALEDSGNYSCEVRGPRANVLGAVTHYLFIRGRFNRVFVSPLYSVCLFCECIRFSICLIIIHLVLLIYLYNFDPRHTTRNSCPHNIRSRKMSSPTQASVHGPHTGAGENGQPGLSWKTTGVNLPTHGKRP
jgi:hypothetical protein